jgi:nicotinate-nucleotide--dimethylbenzimidazole phosphoribosyltransferase
LGPYSEPVPWPRPVPLIGDRTSAEQRRGDPTAWAFQPAARDALHAVIAARRDIRRFRPDPIEPGLLERVLQAAHSAPSVGHSQPWRFLIIDDPDTRQRAASMADRERLAQAALLTEDAGRRLADLQLEGIREAPLGIVVCCDRRTPAPGVLGRSTFPDADLWSCACAIENLWLAARAEGVGVGWVTLFDPAELAALLHLPDGVVTLGWLCLGWPDERPPSPGLERAGWSSRAPLSDVVIHGCWPDEGPAAPPSHLQAPRQEAVVRVRDGADELLSPPSSLGVLDRAIDRVLALANVEQPVRDQAWGTLVLVGADHAVTAQGVSAYPSSVTRDVLEAAVAGEALGVVTAEANGLRILVVDAGVLGGPVAGALSARPGAPGGDISVADALRAADVEALVDAGRRIGRDAHGPVALGEVGIGNTTVAAALATALLDVEPHEMVGLGAGADSAMLGRKREVVALAVSRVATKDPLRLLGAIGGGEIAVLTGVVLGAAAEGKPVILDGLATSVAALLAVRLEPAVAAHLVAGHRSRESGHPLVLGRLGLEPLLDLRLRSGEGVGASLATGMLRNAMMARARTARTGSPVLGA